MTELSINQINKILSIALKNNNDPMAARLEVIMELNKFDINHDRFDSIMNVLDYNISSYYKYHKFSNQ